MFESQTLEGPPFPNMLRAFEKKGPCMFFGFIMLLTFVLIPGLIFAASAECFPRKYVTEYEACNVSTTLSGDHCVNQLSVFDGDEIVTGNFTLTLKECEPFLPVGETRTTPCHAGGGHIFQDRNISIQEKCPGVVMFNGAGVAMYVVCCVSYNLFQKKDTHRDLEAQENIRVDPMSCD